MDDKLKEKIGGLLDVAVDMGTTLPKEVIDKMDELYANTEDFQQYDYFYMQGIIDALYAVYTAQTDNAEYLEKISNDVCDYCNELWDIEEDKEK